MTYWITMVVMAILLIRSLYLTGRLKDHNHNMRIVIMRAEAGFNRIRRQVSDQPDVVVVILKDIEREARELASEMKREADGNQ